MKQSRVDKVHNVRSLCGPAHRVVRHLRIWVGVRAPRLRRFNNGLARYPANRVMMRAERRHWPLGPIAVDRFVPSWFPGDKPAAPAGKHILRKRRQAYWSGERLADRQWPAFLLTLWPRRFRFPFVGSVVRFKARRHGCAVAVAPHSRDHGIASLADPFSNSASARPRLP